ncbi:MAG: DNA-binding response regulator [Planctomycetaceae bacterium]|nr:DNA-binding response regulator [Planctomycetaceae bacterium]|tara:strand:+ start:1970 stop:2599 length:630 start_codon:yes stop_codon:yes gene_type:complete
MAISVLVADDHPMVRSGLDELFSGTEISVIAVAGNTKDTVAETMACKPDVVLLDVRMNEDSGLDALEEIKQIQPQTPVVILSTYDNPTYVARAHALGASDYITKETSRDNLVRVVAAAANGESPIDIGLLYDIAAILESKKGAGDDVALTNRESQVLRHIALGLSNREIANSLSISIETVKEHVQNILRKIRVSDRTQAAVWAVRRNLV